jgi:hypothetical protein
MAIEDAEPDEQEVDPLLGEQRMVADPRISAGEPAALLGKPFEYVSRLVANGRLRRHGPPNSFRQLLLSDVQRCGTWGIRSLSVKPRSCCVAAPMISAS